MKTHHTFLRYFGTGENRNFIMFIFSPLDWGFGIDAGYATGDLSLCIYLGPFYFEIGRELS